MRLDCTDCPLRDDSRAGCTPSELTEDEARLYRKGWRERCGARQAAEAREERRNR